ncbi:hypothetical protein ACFV4K_24545 [Nocardia sp. NPDC059764]|uniref:hypothetical protein n=1 Tax=Nocardia sp. NPDC059764 TaxID=3346939 RepID=UPI003653F4E2
MLLAVTGRASPRIHGVRIVGRSNQSRRQLRYIEIAVLELLRGDWRSTVDDGWTALVDSISREIRAGRLRLDKLRSAARVERCATLHAYWARLESDLDAVAGTRPVADTDQWAGLGAAIAADPQGFMQSWTILDEPVPPELLPAAITEENVARLIWESAAWEPRDEP